MGFLTKMNELKKSLNVHYTIKSIFKASIVQNPEEFFVSSYLTNILKQLKEHDSYTYYHCYRVAVYMEAFSKFIGGTPKQRMDAFYAGLFHDIGKLKIPKEILIKPTKLTKEEFKQIKNHCSFSEELIKEDKNFLFLAEILRSHHERVDGKGYPDQKRSGHIPHISKMIFIVDTFDAITSCRTYNKSRSIDEALKIINEVKGIQLDKSLAILFTHFIKELAANNEVAVDLKQAA